MVYLGGAGVERTRRVADIARFVFVLCDTTAYLMIRTAGMGMRPSFGAGRCLSTQPPCSGGLVGTHFFKLLPTASCSNSSSSRISQLLGCFLPGGNFKTKNYRSHVFFFFFIFQRSHTSIHHQSRTGVSAHCTPRCQQGVDGCCMLYSTTRE